MFHFLHQLVANFFVTFGANQVPNGGSIRSFIFFSFFFKNIYFTENSCVMQLETRSLRAESEKIKLWRIGENHTQADTGASELADLLYNVSIPLLPINNKMQEAQIWKEQTLYFGLIEPEKQMAVQYTHTHPQKPSHSHTPFITFIHVMQWITHIKLRLTM